MTPRPRCQRGSVAAELVLLTPALLAIALFVAFAGREAQAQADVTHAAGQAARAASLRNQPADAETVAQRTAAANLGASGVHCAQLHIDVDTAAFAPGGSVAVTVACTADLTDLAVAGLPGQRTLTARAVDVIDRYRGGRP